MIESTSKDSRFGERANEFLKSEANSISKESNEDKSNADNNRD